MKPRFAFRPLLLASTILMAQAPRAQALTLYWDTDSNTSGSGGATPSGTWSTGGSTWSTDSTGATVTSAYKTLTQDDLFFSANTDATGSYTVGLAASTQNARLVTFEDGTVTLNNGTLSLGNGGGITVTTNTVTGATISSNLTLSGRQTFTVDASRTLFLDTGTFTRSAGSTLNIASTGTVTSTMTNLDSASLVNGIIGPWASFGTGASTRYATIDGSNNIVGYTAGTAAATAASVTSTLGTVNYDVAAVGALGAGASVHTLRYTGGAGTISGALTTNGIMNVGGGTLVFSGAMTNGTAGMVVHAANGGVSFTGGLSLAGNALTVTGSSTVGFDNTANGITGAGGIVMNGTGSLVLSAGGTAPTHTFTGGITIHGGGRVAFQTATDVSGRGNVTIHEGYLGGRFSSSPTFAGGLGTGTTAIQILGGTSGFSGEGGTGSTFTIGSALSVLQWGATGVNGATGFFNPTVLLLGGNQGMNTNAKGSLNNGIDLNGGTRTITSLQSNGDNAASTGFTISGVISNTSATTSGLTKTGPGNIILGSANTFNGITLISGGQLTLSNALGLQNSVLDATNSVTGTASAGLRITPTTMTLGGLSGTKNLSTLFTTTTGGYTALTALTLNPGTGVTASYSGIIANGAATTSLTKTGLGTQTLSGANSYTGGTNVNAGTLIWSGANNLPATGTLSVAANANFSLDDGATNSISTAALSLASGSKLTFDWIGGTTDTLTSTAAATTVAGPVGIEIKRPGAAPTGGPLTLISSGSGGLNNATYYLANNHDYTATLAQSATAVTIDNFVSSAALTNIYWTGNTLAGTSTSGIDNAWALSTGAVTNWSSTTTAYTATGLTPGSTTNVIFATGQVGKAQQTTVLGANMTVNSVTIDDATAVTIGGGNILTLLSTSGTAGTVASPGSAISVTANAANPTISSAVALGANQTWNVASGKTLTVGGVVSGAFSLTKADAGTVVLNGVNTYSGDTVISSGTLRIGTNATANGAVLGGGNYAGNITNNGTLNIQTNANQILSGVISGTGSLVKLYSGTLTLSGANTYTGKTSITPATAGGGGGTLVVSSFNSVNGGTPLLASSSLGAPTTIANGTIDVGSGTIQAGAVLQYTGSGETTDRVLNFPFNSSSTRTIDASGTGLLKFTSAPTASGGTSGGLTLTGTGSGEFANVIPLLGTTTGALTKSGTGTWTLSAANVFTNAVTISGGTLRLGDGGTTGGIAAGSAGITVTSPGNLTIDRSNAFTQATDLNNRLITGTGSFTQAGAGTTTLSALNTYSGTTLVSAGTLNLTGARVAASGAINVYGGTLGINNASFNSSLGANDFRVGTTGLNGTVNHQAGAISFSSGNQLLIGNGTGSGTYNLSGGTITTVASVTRGVMLGVNTGSSGTFHLSGTGSLQMTTGGNSILQIGRSDSAANNTTNLFNQTGGTANIGILAIGGNAATGTGINSTLTLDGGTFIASSFTLLAAGDSNTAVINIGGTADVTLPDFPTVRGTGSTATIHFDGGTLKNSTVAGTLMTTATTAYIKAGGASFDTTAGSTTISANLLTFGGGSPNGGLIKSGANSLALSGTNTYTGTTTVSVGTLAISGAGSINATSGITVAAGAQLKYNSSTALTVAPNLQGAGTGSRAVLSGTGTINASLTLDNLGDTLSPGNSPGVLPFAMGQTWASGSYDWELNDWANSVAGTDIDQITISGALDLSAVSANEYVLNILSLKDDNTSGLVGDGGANIFSEVDRSWTILTASSITGFDASEWNINAAGFTDAETGVWSINQVSNDLVLTYTAIPEPGAAFLGGLGVLLILRRRRD